MLVVNTGFIVYAIVSPNRVNSTGIDIIIHDTPCNGTVQVGSD